MTYTSHRKAFGQTDDQSAMTRWSEQKLEDNRDDHIVIRKKNEMIFRLMIGENQGSDGASRSGSDARRSLGDWTNIGLETEAELRKRRSGKPTAVNDIGPETGRRKSGS